MSDIPLGETLAGALPRKQLPHGYFYRRVVVLPEGDCVRAAVEDESHHMELKLFHDGKSVIAVQGMTHRIPWSECPGAPLRLADFVGISLRRMHQSTGLDGRLQCTHLFDLTRLSMARALIGKPVQYDIAVEDRIDNRTHGVVLRDGVPALRWEVEGTKVTGPEPYVGHSIFGRASWPTGLDEDTLEAALVLRRVFLIAQIREPVAEVSRHPRFGEFSFVKTMQVEALPSRCHNFHTDRLERVRYRQTWRNYDGRREDLLKDFPGVRTLADLQRAGG
jgi:Protein of unknown function (DUF2889)